ncbi:MAG TPA: TolC family protein [Kofleriaceae bacterium]|nr:TolC family protein [Kofleriaceae bacterium]
MLGRWLAVLSLVTAASSARADDAAPAAPYVPPDFLSATPPLPDTVDAANTLRLDLPQALQMAVRQNLGVTLERRETHIAELGVDVARGLFEPEVDATYAHGSSRTPPSSAQEGMAGEILRFTDDRWDLSINQRLATGMQLSATWTSSRSDSSLGTAVEPINYRSALTVGIRQPLLRGFSFDLDLPQLSVLQARISSERERRQLSVVVAEVVERTEAAYWEVLRALYNYDLQRRSQKRAEEQLDLTKRQIAAGAIPPADLISAESTLAQRQLQVVQAEQLIEASWDQLRSIINMPRDEWTKPILPVDVPHFEPHALPAAQALETALKHRPEIEQIDLELRASELSVRKADNDKLPQIDLGLSGSVVGQDGQYSGALSQLGGFEARGWNVFVNFTWTPLRRATSAQAEIERTRHEIATARREQLVQQIWLAVREAVRNQDNAARQVAAAAHFRQIAEKTLEVEQRKFLNGSSSQVVVAQRQEELAAAQIAEVGAVLDHTKAVAALGRATGELLGQKHIELSVGAK